MKRTLSIPNCCEDTIEVIEIIIAPPSLSLVRLACVLKLFDIPSEAYGNLMLFILRDGVFGLLDCIIDPASVFFAILRTYAKLLVLSMTIMDGSVKKCYDIFITQLSGCKVP